MTLYGLILCFHVQVNPWGTLTAHMVSLPSQHTHLVPTLPEALSSFGVARGGGGPHLFFPWVCCCRDCVSGRYVFPFWPEMVCLMLRLNPQRRVGLAHPWAESGLTWHFLRFYPLCSGAGASLSHFEGSSRRLDNLVRIGLIFEPLKLFCG